MVLLLQYCGITVSWQSEQVPLKYHFVKYNNYPETKLLALIWSQCSVALKLLYACSLIAYLHTYVHIITHVRHISSKKDQYYTYFTVLQYSKN